jgi:glycosyl transferase family (putative galactosyltransferase)
MSNVPKMSGMVVMFSSLVANMTSNEGGIPPGCRPNRLRIAVGMLNSVNIPEYANYATIVNQEYCRRHGYDFIIERCPDGSDHPDWLWDGENEYLLVWHKATFIRKHLGRYHYFVFIDSDAIFEDMSKRIEDVLIPLFSKEEKACFIVGEDCWEPGACWNKNELNTGFIVARNRPETFHFLKIWQDAFMEDGGECAHLQCCHPREQACMTLIGKRPEMRERIHIVPASQNLIGQRFSSYVRHLAGMTRSDRLEILRRRAHKLLKVYAKGKEGGDVPARPFPLVRLRLLLIWLAALATAVFLLLMT